MQALFYVFLYLTQATNNDIECETFNNRGSDTKLYINVKS